MHPFEYTRETDVATAIGAVAGSRDDRFIAGGTTLIDLMKLNVETPSRVIDINHLAETDPVLGRVEGLPGGGLRIGALVRNSDLAWNATVKEQYPVLAQALLAGASGQLRNMATVGGNLMQRTRCYYFRDTAMPCNKREPGTGCSALNGANRMHAVLGASEHCIATHPSDMAVALAALDAVVVVRSPNGERRIPLTEFHLEPGAHPEQETVLRHGELIVTVDVPPLPYGARSHYLKVRDRASYAFALASAAVAMDLRGGIVRQARVALGGVGTKPWRSPEAERVLAGARAGPSAYRAAAEAALRGAVPRRDNRFKIELARRTLVRALTAVQRMA
ncbi:MAG: FAD binding domain-containing protein [Gemmatimonadales bacterium]